MAKRNISLTLNIPDDIAPVIINNLNVLKDNERLTEFLGRTVLEKLQDVEAIEQLNQKVKLNGHGTMQGTEEFYRAVLERLKTLETQIEALRYDMHTAAVLADKALYKELSANIMGTIDVLFRNLSITIKLNVSDYVEQRKWIEREAALQQKFASSLSNFRLLQAAFDDDTDIVLSPEDTLHTEDTTASEEQVAAQTDPALLEKIDELLKGMEDIKYVLRNSTVLEDATIRRNIQFSGTELTDTQQSTTPAVQAVQPTPNTQTSEAGVVKSGEETPALEDLDLDALTGFFM